MLVLALMVEQGQHQRGEEGGEAERTISHTTSESISDGEPVFSELKSPRMERMVNFATLEALRSSAFFKPLSNETLEALAAEARPIHFDANQRIKTPDQIVLVIQSGDADFYLFDAADKEFLLSQQGPGTLLGELSYLVQNRSEDEKIKIVARSAVEALQIPSDKFFEAVLSNPAAAEEVLKLLAERLTAMNRFTKQAVDVNLNPAEVKPTNWQERAADWVTDKMGSFSFLGSMGVVTAGWIGGNVLLASTVGWDPPPFILLNLVFSIMSAGTASLVLISQKRQSQVDRIHAHTNHQMTLALNQQFVRLRSEIAGLRQQLGASDDPPESP